MYVMNKFKSMVKTLRKRVQTVKAVTEVTSFAVDTGAKFTTKKTDDQGHTHYYLSQLAKPDQNRQLVIDLQANPNFAVDGEYVTYNGQAVYFPINKVETDKANRLSDAELGLPVVDSPFATVEDLNYNSYGAMSGSHSCHTYQGQGYASYSVITPDGKLNLEWYYLQKVPATKQDQKAVCDVTLYADSVDKTAKLLNDLAQSVELNRTLQPKQELQR